MVFAIRPSYKKGNMVGARVFGILTSVFLAAGLLPQYYEIYKFREVIGISIPFMLIDCLGGTFFTPIGTTMGFIYVFRRLFVVVFIIST